MTDNLACAECGATKTEWAAYRERGETNIRLRAELTALKKAVLTYLDAPPSGAVDHGALEDYMRRLAEA